jgi:hypothetical protein
MTRNINHRNERGVALLLSILALILLSAIAVTMVYMSSTERAIGANFRAEETEYFAARAGIEEIRDRMIPSVPNYSLNGLAANNGCPGTPLASPNCYLPTQLPGVANGAVVYILQSGVTMANVTTPPAVNAPNPIFDDELCHDYTIGAAMAQSPNPNVPCAALPPGAAWYTQPPGAYGVTSAPNGSLGGVPPAWAIAGPNGNPLDWKWVRITLKADNSVLPYPVDNLPASQVPGAVPASTTPVCWNGYTEVLLAGGPTCQQRNPPLDPWNPVYLVTSLSVSSSGARRLVQSELAQTPTPRQPGGLFATGAGCAALKLGGGATTYSFDSSALGYAFNQAANPPVSNALTNGGDVGANGNVTVGGGATVNGLDSTNMPDTVGNCNQNNGITNNGANSIGTANPLLTPYTPPSPPFPTNPVPPTAVTTINGANTLAPGTYGSLKITGGVTTLGVAGSNVPAIYTLNSLTVSGGGQIRIAGPVIINLNYSGSGDAINLGGNGFVNAVNPPIASNFVINYGGPGNVQVNGGASAFAIINAPNANVTLNGGSDFFGQVLGKTIDDTGGTSFYWDAAAKNPPLNTSPYFEISMRELSY